MIVGLGNVGREYEGTRHNVGFAVVDGLAAKFKRPFTPGKGEYYFAQIRHAGEEVILLKPTTYMNNSGVAVSDAADRFGITPEDILVIYDDFNIPLGKLRLRKNGGDGGHNGVYSIIYQLNDENFSRLRCGIGTEEVVPGRDMADFVLSKFEAVEVPVVEKMVEGAVDAAFVFINEGIETAMNRFN
ncbi:MAG: aminoacyl-tRNA hydrolase [Bacteroidetes bacterium]|nr:aminoacyl-tRNA hydrolase [Bacteroidota bacterium]